jgi:hypothetical protein
MNAEIQEMLLQEEINIIKALMAVGYWANEISFDSSGRFIVSGGLYHAGNPGYGRLLESKEKTLAALDDSSREQAKGSDA